MALVLANRVQETATPNTTVSFTLTGAVQGFQSFATVGNTNTTYYSATDTLGNWEVGLGTYSSTGPTLTRTTIYASSNSGSAVTFPGSVTVFVTYPSGKSVNLDATGNVSALGTVSSGTWQGSTVGVAYGGTGVTTSSGANSVMLRDANQNTAINRLNQSNTNTTAAGGTTALTAASSYSHTLVGTGNQTFTLPDATTLTTGVAFLFNNRATGTVTIQDYATATIGTITAGGAGAVFLTDDSTVGGTWDVHGYLPEGVTWGTNALNLGSTVISNGTWQGGTIQSGYGGTGLTTFTGANNALYSTSASNLVAGTLPIAAGGTGVTTTPTNGQLLIGNGTNYTVSSLGSGTGISTTTGAGTLTINNTGVTSLAGTSPVTASASTGSVTMSLASGYGDTQNPYASKTANFFLAAPNGSAGAPTFRAIVAADIPTLNQNTTGSAGSVANDVTFNNGGAGDASGTTFNGSAARTISYNTVGAPSTTGTGASGTWAINISGNAATATSATDSTKLPLSGGTMTGTISFNTAFNVQMWRHGSNGPGVRSDGTYLVLARGSGGGGDQQFYIDGFSNILKDGNIVLHAGNYNSYAPTLTGTGASGTWGISISGNAATATSATSATNASNLTGGNISGAMTGTMAAGSQVLELANNDNYLSARVIRNNASTSNRDGMYIGYGNSNSGVTRIYGGGATSGGIEITGSGVNNVTIAGNIALNAGNYNSYAPTLTGTGASGTWGINISGSASSAVTLFGSSNLYISPTNANTLNSGYGTAGDGPDIWLNYRGYNDGFSYFRNFNIGNGKGTAYVFGDGVNQRIGIAKGQAASYTLDVNGIIYTNTDARAPIFYDSNNTAYYLDPASTSRLNSTETDQSYTYGWFRNYSNNTGLYNQNTTQHLSSAINGYWDMSSTTSVSSIRFYTGSHLGALRGYVYADTGPNIGFLNSSGNWRLRVVSDDYTLAEGSSMRAQLFYDSNDTSYYVDPASTSFLNQAGAFYFKNNYDVSTDHPFGLYFANGLSSAYAIYRESGSWTYPYPDLRIAFHTGIKIGANSGYQGIRFYNDYDMVTQVMSVNNGSDPLGANNVYINNALQAGGSLRSPIFYDSDDTGYYVDPNSTSNVYGINASFVNSIVLGRGGGSLSSNIAVGSSALGNNTSGTANVAIGVQSLSNNTSGYDQTAVGNLAMFYMQGDSNTATGSMAMRGGTSPASNTGTNNSAFGKEALNTLTSGSLNVAVGARSYYSDNSVNYPTTATGNVAVGPYIAAYGFYAKSGNDNVLIGNQAAYYLNSGQGNVAAGAYAGNNLNSGSDNTFIGYYAGWNSYGSNIGNVYIGRSAGYNTGNSAYYNVAIGAYALDNGTTSTGYNVAIGVEALGSNTTPNNNVGVGAYAFVLNSTGGGNTGLGGNVAYNNTTGSNNTAVGQSALYNNTTTSSQTAVGYQAMYNMRGGSNTATGYQAMYGGGTPANNTGASNVADGYQTLFSNTSGFENVAVGFQALLSNTSAGRNVAIGYRAAYTSNGFDNVAVGYQALYNQTSGTNNVAIGNYAGFQVTTGYSLVAVGDSAAYSMRGAENTAIGQAAMVGSGTPANNTGVSNVALGSAALYVVSSGARNNAIGANSLRGLTTGTDNVALGFGAGYRDAAFNTGNATTSGTFNIYIGNYAYPGSPTATRELVIGYNTTGKGSNSGFINVGGSIYQGNNTTTWATTSDVRIKENFVPVTDGLAVINALEPFEFDYILTGKHDVGFKAQQYMTVLPDQITKHAASEEEKQLVGDNELYGIQRNLDPYFVSAIKALTEQVKALQQEIAQLKGA